MFEADCPRCATSIEFLRGDVAVRCHGCKRKVINPRFDPGCAAWCAYAEQCLGNLAAAYRQHPEFVRDRLEAELRRTRPEPQVVERAIRAGRQALEAALKHEGDPLVVTAACLLQELDSEPSASAAAAKLALAGLGLPPGVISQVEKIVSGQDKGSLNARLCRAARQDCAAAPELTR